MAASFQSPSPTTTAHAPAERRQSSSQGSQGSPSTPVSLPEAWSGAIQATLDQPPTNLAKRLLVGGVLFTSVVGCWGWFGHIEHVSQASGQLVPLGESHKVQPVLSGKVDQILVQEGDTVEAGQLIVALDDQRARSEVEQLTLKLASQQTQLEQTRALVERTQNERAARQAITRADIDAHEEAIQSAAADVVTSRRMTTHLNDELEAHRARLAQLQPLVDVGALAQDYLFPIEQSIRERQQTLTQTEGSLEKGLAERDRLQAQLTRQQAEGERSQVELEQRLQALERELIEVQASISETETSLKIAQATLEQMSIHAPHGGQILALKLENSGEIVQSGQTIAEIAPATAPLILSATLPSREAGLVEVDMPVNLKFDAFPYQDYGIISGTVVSISPDAEVNQHNEALYDVEIALSQDYIMHEGQAVALRAGQTAAAEIVVRRQRILALLFDPLRQLQAGGITL